MLARSRLCPILLALAALPALSALPAAAAAAPAAKPPARTPQVPAGDGPPSTHGVLQRRPKLIVYSVDGAAYVGGLHQHHRRASPIAWSSWGRTTATGTGANWLDDCRPNCVDGHYSSYRATIRLDRPRRLGGHLVFSRLTVAYTGRRPPGRDRHFVLKLRYARRGSIYIW